MITVIKPFTLVHESADSLHECTSQQMKLVLATMVHNYRTIKRKIPDQGAAVHHSSQKMKCHKIFFHMPCKLPSTSRFWLDDACTKSALYVIWQYSRDEQNTKSVQ